MCICAQMKEEKTHPIEWCRKFVLETRYNPQAYGVSSEYFAKFLESICGLVLEFTSANYIAY